MQKKTYLQESIKGGRLMRWNMMPLKVFIEPMKFYSKQGQDLKYRRMVIQALDEWHKVSNGKVSFVIVDNLLSSNVNIVFFSMTEITGCIAQKLLSGLQKDLFTQITMMRVKLITPFSTK